MTASLLRVEHLEVRYGDLIGVMNLLRDAGDLKLALVGLEVPSKP